MLLHPSHLFELGRIVGTPNVLAQIDQQRIFELLDRHAIGDWGTLCDEDVATNNDAVRDGNRLLSAYEVDSKPVWVITEWDRSVTTVLFPEEY